METREMIRYCCLALLALLLAVVWLTLLEVTAFSGAAVSLGLLVFLALPELR
jgi:hypothetical protein